MNIYKNHRKLILYISIALLSIFLIIFIPFISLLFVNLKMITLQSVLFLILVIAIVYVYCIFAILKKLDLHPPKDLRDFLSSHSLKIKFYNIIAKILKLWNMIVLVLFIFIVIFLFTLLVGFILLIINTISNSANIPEFLSNHSVITYALIGLSLSLISLILIVTYGILFFALIIPRNKSGLFDTSDIPISLITEAIDELNSFNFSLTREDLEQDRKNISNLIYDASEFITVENKFFGIPLGMRYFQLFITGLKSKAAKSDILYRTNGLSERLKEIEVKLNCLKTEEDKEEIANNLIKYLDIIENKDLCEIEPVPYTGHGLIVGIAKKFEPISFIFRLIYH
jgi:hypothetical protein